MKLPDSNPIEVSGSEFESKETRISSNNLGYIFNLLSKYSRPIDSIVREITSNCFDSHIEAGIDDPVVVKFAEDENGEYISFIDVGVGLSKKRIDSIYLDLGNSTKRDDKNQIGSYGIGSKSPFSYTGIFYITTTHNSITYEYIYFRKSNNSKPELNLLTEYSTDKRNGTEVKIYFKDNGDKYSFEKACLTELCYFDNVFFDYPSSSLLNNFYKIYQGTTFKYRPDADFKDLHICLGKVNYPINFRTLGIESDAVSGLPLALKFNIGDIPVEPKRESLEYVTFENSEGKVVSTAEVIKNKIVELKEELISFYKKQSEEYTTDLADYLQRAKSTPRLYFEKELSIEISFIPYIARHAKKLKFKPLVDLGYIGDIPYNPLFDYVIVGEYLLGKKVKFYDKEVSTRRLTIENLRDTPIIRYPESGKFSRIKNEYLLWLNKELGLKRTNNWFFIIKKQRNKPLDTYRNLLNLTIKKVAKLNSTNALKQYQLFTDYIEDYVLTNSTDYENLEVPDEYVELYRRLNKKFTKSTKRKEDEIVVYDYIIPQISKRKIYIKPKQLLQKFTGIVLYGSDEDILYLEGFLALFMESSFGEGAMDKKIKIYKVAASNFKYFKYKCCIHVQDFMSDNKVFKRFATTAIISGFASHLQLTTYNKVKLSTLMEYINPKVELALDELEEYVTKNAGEVYFNKPEELKVFLQEVVAIAKEQKIVDNKMIDLAERLESYFTNLDLIRWVNFDESSPNCILAVLNYFKAFNKAVDSMYKITSVLDTYEYQIYLDSIDKIQYLESVYINGTPSPKFGYTQSSTDRLDYINKRDQTVKEIKLVKPFYNLLTKYYAQVTNKT